MPHEKFLVRICGNFREAHLQHFCPPSLVRILCRDREGNLRAKNSELEDGTGSGAGHVYHDDGCVIWIQASCGHTAQRHGISSGYIRIFQMVTPGPFVDIVGVLRIALASRYLAPRTLGL